MTEKEPEISRHTGKPKKKPRGRYATQGHIKKAERAHKIALEQQFKIERATHYTGAIAELIIAKIAHGDTIASIAREPGMPCEWTIHSWLRKHEDFAEAYEKAKPARARALAEKAAAELDGIIDKDTAYIGDVRIRNRLKLAAIFDPNRYSEKHIVQHQGDVAIQLSVNLSRFEPQPKALEAEAVEVPMVGDGRN